MTSEPVDTASKERRHQAYHITLLPCHDACPDLITGKLWLCYCFTLITAMFFLLTIVTYKGYIVRATNPQSIWMSEAWCENYGKFLLCKVRNIRNHSRAIANQHLCCSKERKWDTKEDQGKSMMHALTLLRMVKRHLSGWSDIKWWKTSL